MRPSFHQWLEGRRYLPPGGSGYRRERDIVVTLPDEATATKFEKFCNTKFGEFMGATAAEHEVLIQTEDQSMIDAIKKLAAKRGWSVSE